MDVLASDAGHDPANTYQAYVTVCPPDCRGACPKRPPAAATAATPLILTYADPVTGVILLTLNVETRTATRLPRSGRGGRKTMQLTPRQCELLKYLMHHPEKPCRREDILKEAWGSRIEPDTNIVDVNIRRLRVKIDGESDVPLIHTIRSTGYMLTVGR